MKQIVVYADKGVDGGALKHTLKTLQKEVDLRQHTIVRLDAEGLKKSCWEKKSAALVIPGGRDIYYHKALDGEGTDKIKDFVTQGGLYFGICAGAYFASALIEFEKGGLFEVCAKRSLRFFPGMAQGPAYGTGKYDNASLRGVEASLVSVAGKEPLHVYFNGGCQFAQAHLYPEVSVVAQYHNLENNPAAIIRCPIGSGLAILSGVHLEYSAEFLPTDNPYIKNIYELIQKSEEKRRSLLRSVLEAGRIKLI